MKIFLFTCIIVALCSCSQSQYYGDGRYVEGKRFKQVFFQLDSRKMWLGNRGSYVLQYKNLPVKSLPQYIVIEKSHNDPYWATKVVYITISMYENDGDDAFFRHEYRIPIVRGINRKQTRIGMFKNQDKPEPRSDYLIKVDVTKGSGHGGDKFYLHSYANQKDKLY